MSAEIIDGKKISNIWKAEIAKNLKPYFAKYLPTLGVVLVGDNPASHLYVRKKIEALDAIGMSAVVKKFKDSVQQSVVLNCIDQLNHDNKIHGILVQLPLPKQIDPLVIMSHILPEKDVDGLHPVNIGKLAQGAKDGFRCCTPKGVMYALSTLEVGLKGMNAVVVGQSNIVGRPMALELLNAGCTVSVCHRHTKDLKAYVKKAKLLIVAVGQPHLIKKDDVRSDALVVDVGTTVVNGRLLGDVHFEEVINQVSYITPVPGGVGPLTITALLDNMRISFLKRLQYSCSENLMAEK